jgi:hypothetical protein
VKHKAVKIVWVDSASSRGWLAPDTDGPATIHSCGYIVNEEKGFIVISTSISNYGHVMDQLAIPRVCIKAIKKIP